MAVGEMEVQGYMMQSTGLMLLVLRACKGSDNHTERREGVERLNASCYPTMTMQGYRRRFDETTWHDATRIMSTQMS